MIRFTPVFFFLMTANANAATVDAQALRYQANQNGDFVLIGNSLGFDCASTVPAPVVGTVGTCKNKADLQGTVEDNSVDVYWRTDDPTAGSVWTNNSVLPAEARSTSMLQIPSGARITYARLYFAAIASAANGSATLDGPGGTLAVVADDSFSFARDGHIWYNSTLDVTAIVSAGGPGAYRLSEVASYDYRSLDDNNAFEGWAMVVFYELASEPPRNLSLFDGFLFVDINTSESASINGFLVPNTGYNAKLGVIAYEGDEVYDGDSLEFNGHVLSDDQNPPTNFFNSTRSWLGSPVSVAGDLPQANGKAASMTGLDLDVVDISSYVKPGDTSALTTATSNGNDSFAVGAFITSISTLQPDFSFSTKVWTNLAGTPLNLPGQTGEFTFTITNTGNDTAVNALFYDALPKGLTYVPGSLSVTLDPASAKMTALTDQRGDDAGEYDALARTVVVRLGNGANAVNGGTVPAGATLTLIFSVSIDAGVYGTLYNQGVINGGGQAGAPPIDYPTRPTPTTVGPTPVVVAQCSDNSGCSGSTPLCDNDQCVGCTSNNDCTGTTPICVPILKQCEPCGPTSCTGATPVCLPSGACGPCGSNSECSGSTPICDSKTSTCVGCLNNGDCSDATPVCIKNQCGCGADSDCPKNEHCDLVTQHCEAGCPPGASCDNTTQNIPPQNITALPGGSIQGGGVGCHGVPASEWAMLFVAGALGLRRRRR